MHSNKYKVLIVEDDYNLRSGLALALSSDTMETVEAATILDAKKWLETTIFNLILLDCNLPDGSGIDFCRMLRERSDIPIIFLTVNDAELEIVSAFRVGATDYVTKPFSVMVLRERINAILKRTKEHDNVYTDSCFIFNFSTLEYKVNGEMVTLSSVEQKILRLLVSNKKRIIPRERIIDSVWSVEGEFIDDNALTVAVKRLRAKIGPESIKTVYGLGYMWNGGDA